MVAAEALMALTAEAITRIKESALLLALLNWFFGNIDQVITLIVQLSLKGKLARLLIQN
jgi:hypothetical protein